jgi:hypothetical protein
MTLTGKKFTIKLLIIALIALSFPMTVLAANPLSSKAKSALILVSGPAAPGTYSYAGTITNISSSSITLYHGPTCIITVATVCKAPMSGGNMMNMQPVSCSSFTKGETVQISAVENSNGQLVATTIQEAFF